MRANFERIKLEIFGTSHSDEMSVRLGGLPGSVGIPTDSVSRMLDRRRARSCAWSTPRLEKDEAEFISGVKVDGDIMTVEDEVAAIIKNGNVRQADYSNTIPRPSHADYAAYVRDGKIESGGGRFSGRLTAPLCVAGAIAEAMLENEGIKICAYIRSIGDVELGAYEEGIDYDALKSRDFPCLGDDKEALRVISEAAAKGDSVGGTIECVVTGVKAGAIGEAMFEGLEGKIAYSVFGVPAVKGVEFGDGFALARLRGSSANDAFEVKDGHIVTSTNRSGGINGGIANGMPIVVRAALRPTPSISIAQKSVDLAKVEPCELIVKGRHDACIVPRAVPCIESAVALAVLDEAIKYNLFK